VRSEGHVPGIAALLHPFTGRHRGWFSVVGKDGSPPPAYEGPVELLLVDAVDTVGVLLAQGSSYL